MSKLPAFQFYPGDWRKDMGVQSLNFHDRGVWWEMLCLMHESERRGYLMLNGQALNDASLARLLGLDKQILTTTLTTLLESGVASRDEDTGAVYCRRMVRDEKLRQIRSKAGSQGGNPVLLKQKTGDDLVKQIPTTQVKQIPTPSSSTSVKKRTPCIALPEWLPESLWFEYEDMRKKKRAGMTDPIRFRIIKKLERFRDGGLDAIAALEKSIISGWTDVYEPKIDIGGNGHVNGNANGYAKKPTIVEAQLAELQRFTDKRNGNGRQNSGSCVPVGDDDRENTAGGGTGRVDPKPGLLLAGEADWGL